MQVTPLPGAALSGPRSHRQRPSGSSARIGPSRSRGASLNRPNRLSSVRDGGGGHRDSAVTRFSMIIRSHNANMKIRHSLSAPSIRTPILILLVFMNIVSAIYLGLWGLFFLTAHPIVITTLKLFAPVPTGIIYMGLCVWHCIIRLGRHALVVVVLSIHAHHVSHSVVDDWFAFTYTLLVAFYCFVTPSCLLSSHPFIKRYVTLLNDAFFHFLLSTGLSSFLFFPGVYAYATSLTLPWMHHYYHDLVLTYRVLVSTSVGDLALFVFIFVTNHLTLHHLTHVALSASSVAQLQSMLVQKNGTVTNLNATNHHTDTVRKIVDNAPPPEREPNAPQPPMRQASAMPQSGPPLRPASSRLSMFQGVASARRLTGRAILTFREQQTNLPFKVFFVINVVWGVVLVVAACSGLWHAPCVPGCLAHTSPWFAVHECTCKAFELHCVKLQLENASTTQIERVLLDLDDNLFSLHVVHCDMLPHGLSSVVLDRFRALFLLRIEFTPIGAWSHGTLPPTLQVLEVPHILDVAHSDNLPSLVRITHAQLTAIPPPLVLNPRISILDLKANAISTVEAWPPHVQYVDLSNNGISSVPPAVVDAYLASPFFLLLVSNPLVELDPFLLATCVLLAPLRVDIADTPLTSGWYDLNPTGRIELSFVYNATPTSGVRSSISSATSLSTHTRQLTDKCNLPDDDGDVHGESIVEDGMNGHSASSSSRSDGENDHESDNDSDVYPSHDSDGEPSPEKQDHRHHASCASPFGDPYRMKGFDVHSSQTNNAEPADTSTMVLPLPPSTLDDLDHLYVMAAMAMSNLTLQWL
ncbi:hypothetical protein DYB32_000522 [Aphanomyces invadans]|uniref:Uncharacterized protein n=1 Tax=Aphanomyces invadans TaxID=157072 RepID=A0A418B9N7_9STRA|nr:hypothetical protein DYB32_000522 [Aphanomyces invadans]